ncbi:MAG: hypothetical protein QME94_00665 [Anaerolineae bacterium]|nr:hypothetical protein [Anaerolineae bacterium]
MASTRFDRDLRGRALGAMLSHAFFRLESALTIALTIVLIFLYPAPFYWWRWWYWLLLGLVGEALIIYTSLSDAATAQQVVADMLRQSCNPAEVRSSALRTQVERALEYRRRIGDVLAEARSGPLRDHLQDTASGIADWIGNIYNLARRLDAYESDDLIRRDRSTVQSDLEQLQRRLAHEDDPAVRAEIEQAIRGKRTQQENLERLQNTMERAEIQLDATLTALGTVYSQLLLVGARGVDSARSRRIAESIREQVAGLSDLLSAMNDVYGSRVG